MHGRQNKRKEKEAPASYSSLLHIPRNHAKDKMKNKKINDFKNSMLNQTRNLFRSILMRQREQIIRKKLL